MFFWHSRKLNPHTNRYLLFRLCAPLRQTHSDRLPIFLLSGDKALFHFPLFISEGAKFHGAGSAVFIVGVRPYFSTKKSRRIACSGHFSPCWSHLCFQSGCSHNG